MPMKFRKKSVIWTFSASLLVVALLFMFFYSRKNQQPEKEHYKVEKKRLSEIFTTLDSTFWKNKDENLLRTEEAIRISKKINDSDALARAYFIKARILRKYEENNSSLLVSNQALVIAEKINDDTLIAKIKHNIGNYYQEQDNYYMSMLYYTEVEKIADKLHNKLLTGMASNGLGLVSMSLNDYDKAIEYFKKAMSVFDESDRDNVRNSATMLANIGACYLAKGDYSNATIYCEKALTMAGKIHDTDIICRIYDNLGLINQELKNQTLASDYFYKALIYSKNVNNRRANGIATFDLGNLSFANNELVQAEEYFNQSLIIFSEIGFRNGEMRANAALSDVKKQQGQWQKAFDYYSRYVELRDSIFNSSTQKKISDYQWEMKSQKKRFENELLLKKYEIQKKRNMIFAIIIIFILILAFVFSRYLNKSIKLQKIKNQHLHDKIQTDEKINGLEKFKHQVEIETKNSELSTISFQLVTKNEILLNVSKIVDQHYDSNSINKAVYNDLNKTIKDGLNTDKDWDQFKDMFEQVHHNFFLNIKNICPALTENELRFCAFLRINLLNKEIAQMLNSSNDAIKKTRYRIRKKLNLDSKTSLEDYIRNI
jgi:tetratricopeptide (TPR) repeat protein